MPVMNMFPGGSTLQIPLDAPTAFSASAGNAQVELTWTDPLDKYATPEGEVSDTGDQLVSEWDHTVLVRKTGSQPAGPNDGTVVVSSSVRNQYQTSAYVDSGLVNDTTYYYGVFAYNKDGVASSGAFTSATPIAGTPVSDLAVGTLIKINENGAPVEYMVVNQGLPSSMYDESCNGCWVIRKDISGKRAWDSTDSDYKNSSIHSYLNGTFVGRYSAGTQSLVKQVKIPYVNGTGANGTVSTGADGLSCKLFLPSPAELNCTWRSNTPFFRGDGSKLQHFTDDSSRIAEYNGVADEYWTRDPEEGYSDRPILIYTDGSYRSFYNSVDSLYGCRHLMVLDPSAMVDVQLNLMDE